MAAPTRSIMQVLLLFIHFETAPKRKNYIPGLPSNSSIFFL